MTYFVPVYRDSPGIRTDNRDCKSSGNETYDYIRSRIRARNAAITIGRIGFAIDRKRAPKSGVSS